MIKNVATHELPEALPAVAKAELFCRRNSGGIVNDFVGRACRCVSMCCVVS